MINRWKVLSRWESLKFGSRRKKKKINSSSHANWPIIYDWLVFCLGLCTEIRCSYRFRVQFKLILRNKGKKWMTNVTKFEIVWVIKPDATVFFAKKSIWWSFIWVIVATHEIFYSKSWRNHVICLYFFPSTQNTCTENSPLRWLDVANDKDTYSASLSPYHLTWLIKIWLLIAVEFLVILNYLIA